MQLCHGDITRKEWVLWNVTLTEAIEWGRYIVKERYEWVEILGRIFGGTPDDKEDKKCRSATVCAMCRKKCGQRLQ
jgi:hypothetical protein